MPLLHWRHWILTPPSPFPFRCPFSLPWATSIKFTFRQKLIPDLSHFTQVIGPASQISSLKYCKHFWFPPHKIDSAQRHTLYLINSEVLTVSFIAILPPLLNSVLPFQTKSFSSYDLMTYKKYRIFSNIIRALFTFQRAKKSDADESRVRIRFAVVSWILEKW